jgi:hypothetical protein
LVRSAAGSFTGEVTPLKGAVRRPGQAFLTGANGLGLPDGAPKGAAGPAGFFGCFGFFASRLLRC